MFFFYILLNIAYTNIDGNHGHRFFPSLYDVRRFSPRKNKIACTGAIIDIDLAP